jgi:chromate reductase
MSNYAIVSGSTRAKSQSLKVSEYLYDRLYEIDQGSQLTLIDLAELGLPDWNEDFWSNEPSDETWRAVSSVLHESEGLVVVSPEWNGMAPPALLNFFLLTSRGEVAHKPALLATVSASGGGAYPATQLRALSPKNTQICYIPEYVIVRDAENMLNSAEPSSKEDAYLRARLDYSLGVLAAYTAAFCSIRKSGAINLESYPYGM